MDQRSRAAVACGGVVAIFLLVQVGALALVGPFADAGYRAVDNPGDPTNSVAYLLVILVATALMLAAIRFDLGAVIRLLVVASAAYISLFVLRLFVPPVVTTSVGGLSVNVLAVGVALALGVALWVYPEWYVIDAAGVLMGAGAAALFGISFGLLPALVLLVGLAIYDAISVYGTEHMLTLASGVMDLKVPIVLVVPLSLSYSYLSAEMPDPTDDGTDGRADGGRGADDQTGANGDPADRVEADDATGADRETDAAESETATDRSFDALDREALFIGLGDAIIPTVLVASAAVFVPASVPTLALGGIEAALPALTAMVGTLAGLVVLLWLVLRGWSHAGLPCLNGGAIAGYLVGALVSGMSLAQAFGLA
jgi:presenilin-like A22 family membrane protease